MPKDAAFTLEDWTDRMSTLIVTGPKSREVMAKIGDADLSLPWLSMREAAVAGAWAAVLRLSFAGELGWELHVPTEFARHVYDTLWEAGQPHGIRNVGYRAIESLRLEKRYIYWSGDLTPDYTPIEAGLGFRGHLKAKGDFIGRAVLERQKAKGPDRALHTFVTDAQLPVSGGEPILLHGKTVSLATSAGRGHSVGKTILMGYLPRAMAGETAFECVVFGETYPVTRVDGPLYDPNNDRLKA